MRFLGAVAISAVVIASGCGSSGRTTYTSAQTNWVKYWPRQSAPAVDVAQAQRIINRNRRVVSLLGTGAIPTGSFVWLTANRRPPVVVLRYPLHGSERVDVVVPYAVN